MSDLAHWVLIESWCVQQGGSEPDQAQLVKRLEAIFPTSSGAHAKAPAAGPAAAAPQVKHYIGPNMHRNAHVDDL